MTADHEAFLAAAMPHLDAVFTVARRAAPAGCPAEDLVQETYLRAFAGFERCRGSNVRSWLISICLNTARSEARRQRSRPLGPPSDPDRADPAAAVDTAESALAALDRAAINDALEQLPDPQRLSLVLMDMAGLTAQEVADILGCPRGTVLARVHRGRRRLAQLLERQGTRHDA